MRSGRSLWLLAPAMVVWCNLPAHAGLIAVQTVAVGNTGNANDSTGYGRVTYGYDIGKFEVTVAQYVAFLNAVAASDPHSLLPTHANDGYTELTRTGSSGAYQYAASTGRGNCPVARISWYSAARFVNWLQNGQQNGATGAASTENGVYDLSLGTGAVRQAGALWALPTVSEWYKAAYYDPTKGGSGGYWPYPTRSLSAPTAQAPPGGADSANYDMILATGSCTSGNYSNVGAYTDSGSYYGTFDQGGNVYEWLEHINSGQATIRGGSLYSSATYLASANSKSVALDAEYLDLGFRVVSLDLSLSFGSSVPEPGTLALLTVGGLSLSALRRRRAKRRQARPA